jgi:hypothetical protein
MSIAVLPFGNRLEAAWKPPVGKSELTLLLYLEISTLCYSEVLNYIAETRCYIL